MHVLDGEDRSAEDSAGVSPGRTRPAAVAAMVRTTARRGRR